MCGDLFPLAWFLAPRQQRPSVTTCWYYTFELINQPNVMSNFPLYSTLKLSMFFTSQKHDKIMIFLKNFTSHTFLPILLQKLQFPNVATKRSSDLSLQAKQIQTDTHTHTVSYFDLQLSNCVYTHTHTYKIWVLMHAICNYILIQL